MVRYSPVVAGKPSAKDEEEQEPNKCEQCHGGKSREQLRGRRALLLLRRPNVLVLLLVLHGVVSPRSRQGSVCRTYDLTFEQQRHAGHCVLGESVRAPSKLRM